MDIWPLQSTFPLKGIRDLVTSLHHLQKKCSNFVERVISLLRKEVWLLAPDASDLEATFKPPVLFVGRSPEKHYISKLFWGQKYTQQSLGKRWIWEVLFPNKKIRNTYMFCIIQTRWPIGNFLNLKNTYCLPAWISGSVDLTPDFRKFAKKNKGLQNTLRTVKRNHYKIEVSTDPQLFDEFFHRMHQPYMYFRYGQSALAEKYDRMKKRFLENSELLFVSKGGQRVAGIMICYKERGALAYRLGVRDGDYQWVARGAISALYMNSIDHCRSKGIQKLSLGGSRPFFSDGVLTYKQKNWNMKIDGYRENFFFLIKPLKKCSLGKTFLNNNPFVSLNKGNLVVNTFVEKNKLVNASVLKRKYAQKGISHVSIHSFDSIYS